VERNGHYLSKYTTWHLPGGNMKNKEYLGKVLQSPRHDLQPHCEKYEAGFLNT
jgi:hypothetical protein